MSCETEVAAVTALQDRLGTAFVEACRLLHDCTGRVVVTGMGKSGHIGNKIAATLASTGTPAFFLHPAEASHGDIGMITHDDVVIAISNSGETAELLTILPVIKRLGVPLIAMTGRPQSTLGKAAAAVLDVSVAEEACPHNLAPTASTTATLAMGDALAVAVLEARGFSEHDFARSHPGGSLGRRLLLHVEDVMRTGDQMPHGAARCAAARRPAGDQPQGPRHDRDRRRRAARARHLHRRRPAPRARSADRPQDPAHGRADDREPEDHRVRACSPPRPCT